MNSKIRKTEDNLITIGSGVMLFGAWTLLRFVLSFIIFGSNIDEAQSLAVKVVAIAIIWVFSLLDAGIRFYIGYAARCEGMRRKKLPYLALTGFLLFLYVVSIVMELVVLFVVAEEILYMLIVLVIDITSLIFLIQLMSNSIAIRKLRKQENGNGEENES